MNCMDGSDASDLAVSTQSQRVFALKQNLANVLVILESFDQMSLDNLEEDEDYNDLLRRFLSTFTSLPLLALANRVDQVIKTGLNDISANISQLATIRGTGRSSCELPKKTRTTEAPVERSLSFGSSSSSSPPTPTPAVAVSRSSSKVLRPGKDEKEPTNTITIHFLQGSCNHALVRVVRAINGGLSMPAAQGRIDDARYMFQNPARPSDPSGIVLACYTPHAAFDDLKALKLSALWTKNAVTHIRRGGTTDYGLRILRPAGFSQLNLEADTRIQVVEEINRVYLHESSGQGRRFTNVTKILGAGLYLFSGPTIQDLEEVVSEGRKRVSLFIPKLAIQFSTEKDSLGFEAVIEPFRLCDLDET